MAAIILRFPAPGGPAIPAAEPASFPIPCPDPPAAAQAEVLRWASLAEPHGWYLVAADLARPEEPCFIIGHRAVDEEGVYQMRPAFDGWELLSRRGSLLVFPTLGEALASICPVPVAA
jgi:hypothetical protein